MNARSRCYRRRTPPRPQGGARKYPGAPGLDDWISKEPLHQRAGDAEDGARQARKHDPGQAEEDEHVAIERVRGNGGTPAKGLGNEVDHPVRSVAQCPDSRGQYDTPDQRNTERRVHSAVPARHGGGQAVMGESIASSLRTVAGVRGLKYMTSVSNTR